MQHFLLCPPNKRLSSEQKSTIGALIAVLSNIHWRVELHLGCHTEDRWLGELIGEHCVWWRQWLRRKALRLRSGPFCARLVVVQWMAVDCTTNCTLWPMFLRARVSKTL